MTNAETSTGAGNAAVTRQGAAVAPASAKGTTKASQKKGAPKASTGAKPASKTPTNRNETAAKQAKPATKPRTPEARDGSKKGAVIELLRRKEGASAAEIAKFTNWQPHTIRGFISTISKKMKLAIESARNEQGDRVYKVK